MRHDHGKLLLIVCMFVLPMLCTPSFAQEVQDVSDTTLSDEVLRQEIDTHMLTPCFDTVFGEMIEEAGFSEQVSVADIMRFIGEERFYYYKYKVEG